MSASPVRPKLASGAIVVAGPAGEMITFQYNPEQVTRRIEPQMVGGQGEHSHGVRFVGAPKETVELQLRFDAIDGLESGDSVTERFGIANRLAQLELLGYPDIDSVRRRDALLAAGTIEIIPEFAPLTLLVLGSNRSMPVKIESMAITEQSFDTDLNPIRATVDVAFHVLTYSDVLPSNPAYGQFVQYQQALQRYADTVANGSPGGT